MPVLLLANDRPDAFPPPTLGPGLGLRSACADRDGQDVRRLADQLLQLQAAPGHPTPRPRGAGLLADLISRPGRDVEAWLVVAPAADAAGERPVGLISLVASRSARGVRHSIGWLIVDPQRRRQGVGRTLAALACRSAAERAATVVWVECRSDWAAARAFWHAVGFTEPV